jgi:hypothetical protein
MDGIFKTFGRIFVPENLNRRYQSGYLGVYSRIILK